MSTRLSLYPIEHRYRLLRENIRDLQCCEETLVKNMIRLRDAWQDVRMTWNGLRFDHLGGRLDGRAVLQQELHHLDAILLARDVERRKAVQGARVRIGFPVEQQLGDPHVPAVRRNVKRGQVVDGHLVHRRPMVQ